MLRDGSRQPGYGGNGSAATAQAVARGLGWFSIALGLAEVAAPRSMTRALGMEGQETLVRAYGVREIATGAAILASDNPQPWIWGRVAGDALDLATLGAGYREDRANRRNLNLAVAAVAGVTAVDAWCARALGNGVARPALPAFLYRDRSGFPKSPEQMRGAARHLMVPRAKRARQAQPTPAEG